MLLISWSIFIIIAIYDLREHRIPNFLLFWLVGFQLGDVLVHDSALLSNFLLGFISFFLIGLALYLVRAMSPGDVKLLGVVGFYIGFDGSASFFYYLLIASGVVATFCLLDNHSNGRPSMLCTLIGNTGLIKKSSYEMWHIRYGYKLVMPFAPSVVIGLALFYYFT
ncbi:prepilin peptidase [Vibrio breoganii]|uniref:prepilin peptidase n=1 Tax=Vibrio breoganii TaxID=553239 RepID=UPI000C822E9D|nr:A24 family peptidase [Vibrio breoganii]PMK32519.1 hypothetical protein BCU03_04765 [Vibrio breoganii]PMK46253.1 hypothetical protein BCU00_07735 [Vibrio breoganii]TKG27181.1 prepilin peptidase [Vibrio breoganii]